MFNNKNKRSDNSPVALLAIATGAVLSTTYLYLKNNDKFDKLRDKIEDVKDEIIDNIKGEDLL